ETEQGILQVVIDAPHDDDVEIAHLIKRELIEAALIVDGPGPQNLAGNIEADARRILNIECHGLGAASLQLERERTIPGANIQHLLAAQVLGDLEPLACVPRVKLLATGRREARPQLEGVVPL